MSRLTSRSVVSGDERSSAIVVSQLRALAADLVFSIQEVDILLTKMGRLHVSDVVVSELWDCKHGLAAKLGAVHTRLVAVGGASSSTVPGSTR